MWPAIASIAAAGLGAIGQNNANRTNTELAREQMRFQERMSSNAQSFSERMANTSVQRSVADYKAAGLNPALAYERSAASPQGVTAGGASGRVENTLRDMPNVVTNALNIKQQQAALHIAQEQLYNLRANTEKTKREAANVETAGSILTQQWKFNETQNPQDIRRLQLANMLSEFGLPSQHGEKWRQKVGGWGNVTMSSAKDFWDWSKDIAAPAGRATGLRR